MLQTFTRDRLRRVLADRAFATALQRFAQRRRRAPAFLEAERGAQSLARDVESAAFIAENITPAPGAPRFASTIAAEGERACSGDGDDSRLPGRRAGKRDQTVMGHDQLVGAQDLS